PFFFPLDHTPTSPRDPHPFPTRRSSDLLPVGVRGLDQLLLRLVECAQAVQGVGEVGVRLAPAVAEGVHRAAEKLLGARQVLQVRSEEHTSELQSRVDLVCRLLLEKKKKT